ncbi:S-adenosyl-L-methionine-dependent methyltransferase [Aulographum hederae CBS 113979]|uniref:S-adenosyl-L-methionine-dependent methyltransferase n=1 Tax=Aulographum hederae CBS 113979 TaxID=1176131 RepID=A0A6G1H9Z9_9PEZI|nr:S-adenosyl-L-methionine-dependent methyltransferase [Aulographum hederae CBS 113979]
MTQPSLYSTFDTSLIDLAAKPPQNPSPSDPTDPVSSSVDETPTAPNSFSTSSSHTLANDANTPTPAPPSLTAQGAFEIPKMPVKHLPTAQTYDAWASVYDSDGNILQGVDDEELSSMLPAFLRSVEGFAGEGREITVVDLGCGTGRNTVKLLQYPWSGRAGVEWKVVVGIDASKGMLEVAREKLSAVSSSFTTSSTSAYPTYKLLHHDFLPPNTVPDSGLPDPNPIPLPQTSGLDLDSATENQNGKATALISTLVLEHIPLRTFFSILSSLVRPGGLALVTNMHPEMGAKGQAGFVGQVEGNETAKVKVRGVSWVHTVEETVRIASEMGWVVEDVNVDVGGDGDGDGGKGLKEVEVTEEMVGKLGRRAVKWVGVRVWYGGVFRRVR